MCEGTVELVNIYAPLEDALYGEGSEGEILIFCVYVNLGAGQHLSVFLKCENTC